MQTGRQFEKEGKLTGRKSREGTTKGQKYLRHKVTRITLKDTSLLR